MAPTFEFVKNFAAAHHIFCPLLSFYLFLAAIIVFAQVSTWRYPAEIQRVREPEGKRTFSFRTRLAYYTNAKELQHEAYEKYSKHGRTCLLPGLGFRNEVILPASSLRWITSHPDHMLNAMAAHNDSESLEWSTGHRKYFMDPWQGDVLRKDVNAVLENLMIALNDELLRGLRKYFGTSTTAWTEINICGVMIVVVAQGSSRFTVGLPLCRDQQYLGQNLRLHNLYFLVGAVLGFLPGISRSLLGPLVSFPCRIYQRHINQTIKPLFTERMKYLKTKPEENPNEPEDYFQMMLRYAVKERPQELNLHDIGVRLVTTNLASFHQTAAAAANLFLNILESDQEYNTITILREEILKVLTYFNGIWSRAAVAKMVRCDSVLRETLRLHGFATRPMLRKVMVENIKTEDGILLPKGCDVSILGYSAHTDGEIFDDPYKFDPFRFSRIREAAAESDKEASSIKVPLPGLRFVSTGSQFLPFGHGRHVCPGRYLVDFELKMILAYVLLHYDLELPEEYGGKRPPVTWIGEVSIAPNEAKIRVRRRVEAKD